MKINEHSVGNFAVLYNRHDEVSDAYISVCSDKYLHWCTENPEMEALRANAEKALHTYAQAMIKLWREEEQAITEQLLKKKSIF